MVTFADGFRPGAVSSLAALVGTPEHEVPYAHIVTCATFVAVTCCRDHACHYSSGLHLIKSRKFVTFCFLIRSMFQSVCVDV